MILLAVQWLLGPLSVELVEGSNPLMNDIYMLCVCVYIWRGEGGVGGVGGGGGGGRAAGLVVEEGCLSVRYNSEYRAEGGCLSGLSSEWVLHSLPILH